MLYDLFYLPPFGPTMFPLRSHCSLIGRWPRYFIGPSSLCHIAKQMNSEGKNKDTMNKRAYLLSSANARMVRNFYDATDALSNQVIV
ncbi:hypothetical protein T07_12962 [Trichinella nelsoni]|uniref:Uncharacterized protein n=1 Tax=Trichinella nelsoni TaxID=6336 RepID=A0A0V0RES3_9BILA|nr:hypothetical protein T07_12962 [Trichinella nelsoni]